MEVEHPALVYAVVGLATVVLTLVLTPIALRYAVRRAVLDRPGDYKVQESPVPYLGGAAILLAFSLIIVAATIVRPPNSGAGQLYAIVGLAVALGVLGLVDDLVGLSPYLRLVLEAGAAAGLIAAGVSAELASWRPLDWAVTTMWVVGVTNAFNLLDNMDGLSAGVAGIAALAYFTIAAVNGQFLVATLAIALAGCAAGFLRSNFHPARIYMGDAGSLFIGFTLAVLGLKLRFEGDTRVTFFVPILVVGVALFDTVLVMVNRLVHGRNPLIGGRDHTSHRLVFVGLPVPVAVGTIYGAAVSLGWLAVLMARLDRTSAYILMAFVLVAATTIGVLLSNVPVYDTSRRRHLRIQEVERPASPAPDRRIS